MVGGQSFDTIAGKTYDKQMSLMECAIADALKNHVGVSAKDVRERRLARKALKRPGRKTNVGDPNKGMSQKKGKK